MRIGLIGSHGTGKSTLVQKFLNRKLDYYTPQKEESRKVVEKGLGINFETSLASQQAFLEALVEMAEDIRKYPNAITSRTLIDLCAYNLYFFRRPSYGLNQQFVIDCQREMKRLLGVWDVFVYVPIEFKLTDENEFRVGQKDSPEYQTEIDTYIQALLMIYGIPYKTVTGSVDQRVLQLETIVNGRTL